MNAEKIVLNNHASYRFPRRSHNSPTLVDDRSAIGYGWFGCLGCESAVDRSTRRGHDRLEKSARKTYGMLLQVGSYRGTNFSSRPLVFFVGRFSSITAVGCLCP